MTNEEVMEMMTDMELHEGGMDNWVMDNAWVKFAKLVAAKEREACAKVCEDSFEEAGGNLAQAIRARGDKHVDDDDIQEYVRPWVVLTDKEIEAIWKVALFADYGVGAELSNQPFVHYVFADYGVGAELSNQPFVHYARAIQAKLKEKNHG